MKFFKYVVILIMTSIFVTGSAFMATTNDIVSTINESIARGDAQKLSKYLGSNVEMNILGSSSVYSKTQAVSILSNFFATNPVKSYSIKQGGSISENTKFSIGTYISTNSDSFKIYYVVKKNGLEEQITKFTIEKR